MAEKPEDDVEEKSKPEDDSKTGLDDNEGIYAFLIVTYFRKSVYIEKPFRIIKDYHFF